VPSRTPAPGLPTTATCGKRDLALPPALSTRGCSYSDSARGLRPHSSAVGARLPRFAIGQALRGRREFALLHCTRTWNVLGVQGEYRTVAQVKRRAERTYPGVSHLWEPTNVTIREAKEFERVIWNRLKCSFCGRVPPEQDTAVFATVISSSTTNSCGKCISDFYEGLTADDPGEGGLTSR
jgi:hypothetical protein